MTRKRDKFINFIKKIYFAPTVIKEKKHALLAPSSAARWLTCTPSARCEEKMQDTTSSYADEGTVAHALAELLIEHKLGRVDKDEFDEIFAIIEVIPNDDEGYYYNEEMHEYCEDFANYVIERYNGALLETPDAKIYTETEVDLSEFVPESFGTLDVCIVSDERITIIDLKYGKGVPVSAVDNKQMLVYAVGMYERFGVLYAASEICNIIYQPRLDSITEFKITVDELLDWAYKVLVPTSQIAFDGGGEFVVGDHCQFCKFAVRCTALAEYNLDMAKHEFADPEELTDEQFTNILSRIDLFLNWAGKVKRYAEDQAIQHDKKWPGYKLVEGRSIRKYTDREQVEKELLKHYKDGSIYKPKEILPLTKMEKVIGKTAFMQYVSKYIIKPPGKPTLVPEDDKRLEINSLTQAQKEFSDDT